MALKVTVGESSQRENFCSGAKVLGQIKERERVYIPFARCARARARPIVTRTTAGGEFSYEERCTRVVSPWTMAVCERVALSLSSSFSGYTRAPFFVCIVCCARCNGFISAGRCIRAERVCVYYLEFRELPSGLIL